MSQRKPDTERLIAALVPAAATTALVAAYLLNPLPSDPDTLFSGSAYAGTLLLFAFFSISLLAWGRVVADALALKTGGLGLCAALGTASASLTACALGHLGLISYSRRGLLIALLLAGPVLSARKPLTMPSWKRLRAEPAAFAVFGALVLLVLLVASNVWSLNFDSDAMYYHLLGPRLWVSSGAIRLPEGMTFILQCSFWDYLHILTQMLAGAPAGGGLIEGHYLAQWTHFVFGFVGSLITLDAILRELKTPPLWRWFGVFTSASGVLVGWTAIVAKNDLGAASWALAGVLVLGTNAWLAGVLFGLAVAAKLSTLFFAVPFGCAWFANRLLAEKTGRATVVREFGLFAASAALAASPFFVRNWLWVGNPVFPYALNFFHGPWNVPYFFEMSAFNTHLSFGHMFWEMLKTLAGRETLLVAALVPGLVGYRYFRQSGPWRLLLPALVFGSFLLFVLAGLGPTADGTWGLRYLGAALILVPGLAAAGIEKLCVRHGISRAAQVAVVFVSVAAALSAKVHAYRPNPVGNEADALRSQIRAGRSKAWLRMNAAGTIFASTGDSHLYYVADLDFLLLPTIPYFSRMARSVSDPYELVDRLRGLGVRYLLDTTHWSGRLWTREATPVAYVADNHPEAIAFSDRFSVVLDLTRIDGERGERCYGRLYEP